jgi:hypothetical protein
MKKILNYIVFVLILLLSSCEKGLDELNENTIAPTANDIDPVFQLSNAVVNSSFPSGSIVYEMGIVQQLISPNGGVLAGANFNQDNRNIIAPLWPAYYRNVIRNTKDVIFRTKEVAEKSNLMNMARIFQAYTFMVLTDTYGDIPYSEAGLGYLEEKVLPKYDEQQSIYTDILKELTEATAALNATGKIETGDILYGGNIEQWKKFGYSLLLRAGMRLSKVDPGKAQQTVQAAFAGGVITNNADNAVMRHDANYPNPIGNTLNGTEAANIYLTKPFVDQLKSTNDPRLSAIAVRYIGATSGVKQTPDVASTDPSKQIGMPMGKDNATILAAATADGLASFYDYSQVDRARMVNRNAPAFFVTAAQTQLLLAEAVHRGWITTGTAKDYYNAGVRANMEQLASYSAASAIPSSAIQAYLDANPFNAANALQQINTQYWIASFLNGPEAWANFRRSGYPALTPNPFAGDIPAGTFINRLTYPTSEISANTTHVNEAITRQGADKLETKVWWDKQ